MTPTVSPVLLIPDLVINPPGPAVAGQGVLIEAGRIAAVAPRSEFDGVNAAVERLPGKTILPGLIDSHLHLEFRPFATDAEVIDRLADDHRHGLSAAVAMTHAQAELLAGTTTVRDCASSLGLLHLRRLIADGAPGPRILACGPPITTTVGHLYWTGIHAVGVEDLRRATRDLCEQGVDAIKVVTSGGVMTAGSDPSKPQFTIEELRTIVDEAARYDRRVVAHALNAEAIRRSAAAGIQAIDHARWNELDAADGYNPETASALVRNGPIVGLTASGWTREKAKGNEDDLAFLRRAFSGHRRLLQAGAKVGVHTDSGATATAFGRLPESLRVASLVADLSPAQVLESVTTTAAAAVGLVGEIGSVAPGYSADLIALDGNPLEDIRALERVHRVYLGGRLVVHDGWLASSLT